MQHETCPRTSGKTVAIAQRLRAHARLCEQAAQETWSEETAATLRQMACDCDRAAEQVTRAASGVVEVPPATHH